MGELMDEYIKRSDALKVIETANSMASSFLEATMKLCVTMDRISAADVVPVVHGMWIWDDEGYHCSECFYHAYGETGEVMSGNWHFCPNCGALMKDGET